MSDDKDSKFVPENSTNEIMRMMRERMTDLVVLYDTMIKQNEDNAKLIETYNVCKKKVDYATLSCMIGLNLCTSAKTPRQLENRQESLQVPLQQLAENIDYVDILRSKSVRHRKIEQDALILYHSHVNHLFHYTIEICAENIQAVIIVREMKEKMIELKERLERIIDTQEALQRNKKKSKWGFRNSYTVEEMD